MEISNSPVNKNNEIPPKGTIFIYIIFVLEAMSVLIINLLGVHDLEPAPILSIEMGIVAVATALILFWVWKMTIQGKKEISTIIYVLLVISVFFDGPYWVEYGVFGGVSELLSFLNFILALVALYLVKLPLRNWYIR